MADNVVGSRPSASGQNDYNATYNSRTTTYDVFLQGRFPWEPERSVTYTGTCNSRSIRNAEFPTMINFPFLLPTGQCEGYIEIRNSSSTLVARIRNTGSDFMGSGFVYEGRTQEYIQGNLHYRYDVYGPPGKYTYKVYTTWDDLFDSGTVRYQIKQKQGQTDIPEDALVKRWNSDFSDYMAPQSREDGFPISWSQDGRMGWEA